MMLYEEAEREFRVQCFLRAAVSLGGNMGRAARRLGVHRNTVWRTLNAAGYGSERVKRMARTQVAEQKKSPILIAPAGALSGMGKKQ